jgi:hypothetical protein
MNSPATFFLLLLLGLVLQQQQVQALLVTAADLSFNSSATTCDMYKNDHDKCMTSSEDGIPCSYCTSAAVGALCAKQTDTKGLPPSVFKCEYQEPTAVADAAWPPPEPTYYYLTCGTIWESNVTFVDYDLIDYFAVVNATTFTLVATNWVSSFKTPDTFLFCF